MQIENILSLPQFAVPQPRVKENEAIAKVVAQYLKTYLNRVKRKDSKFDTLDTLIKKSNHEVSFNFEKEYFITSLEELTNHLVDCFEAYFANSPTQAYTSLIKGISLPLVQNILRGTKRYAINRNSNFYRLRVIDRTKKNSSKLPDVTIPDLFHIPFHLRRFITTQRYSMPGFPCLYLGSSLGVAYHEVIGAKLTSKRNLREIPYAIRLTNNYPLNCFDLAPLSVSDVLREVHAEREQHKKLSAFYKIYKYSLVWPLIASCYYQLEYTDKRRIFFKAEYIVPQLMLQWFQDAIREIDGIRYLSINMCHQCDKKEFIGFNYVFPAKEVKDAGHCSILKHSFAITSPLSAETFQIKNCNDHLNIHSMEKALLRKKSIIW